MRYSENERTLKLVDRLVKTTTRNQGLQRRALRMRARLTATPMEDILDKVPGRSATDKAKAIGVSRQTYYNWLGGGYRPNIEMARKLKTLTGLSVGEIRGVGAD